ncbi:5-oxoprolinase subunit C family protein [Psychroserpens damuponensis]|uniref:5-oxoprolinase subunit C family protein n=1 Tax=Psychroserpens damuponensis TaxID=943936 RepID=UPI00058CBDA4|nr:biotin-dependent carboxyltransferase family protein [Psychroserpens damuponensis]
MVRVLKAGLYDSIQDQGRVGVQEFGVPLSGAMDQYSAALANSILGNDGNAAVLESVAVGPHLSFSRETLICVTGADMNIVLNMQPIKNNTVYEVRANDELKFGTCQYGYRSYLAVLGGFQTREQFGSRSMCKGITASYKLLKGDVLPTLKVAAHINKTFASVKINKSHFETYNFEVFKGPEFCLLGERQQQQLFESLFTISKDSNRMAFQLDEPFDNALCGMITSLVLPGTVQLTPSGKLIILMRDCQTTGGYPRVLQLTEKSINSIVQQFIGSKIAFKCLN